ncbi:MAG TPA: AAA family ATPase [Saprospiraceae bacterium]|jgi:predicted ATP-dependent endonuclease of OLD family|nr:AAA family ATPase [Saprospiraceae bacterium]HND15785.1 AAA family ATPase [Saprospiraceae bacterium]HNG06361.1 AAA family ATPase [Saprospiraceae bacterium]HNG13534.1 AAA family ATPase [Saprospiraceae bacterium]HNJ64132.1 AAA family ATPase [Saprospiraceae bacterium]
MQRIEIKNFGPIKELNLDIKDFSLLIGPQASGKSTIAKTIFFFKSLNDELVKYFIESIDKNDFSKSIGTYAKSIRKKYLDYFGASTHLDGLHLKYYYTETVWISITIETNHKYITPIFSKIFSEEFNTLVKEAINFSDSIGQRNPSLLTSKDLIQLDSDKRKFVSNIKSKCNSVFQEDRELMFIPAGRSLLATLSDQLQFINPRNLDFLMRSFLDKINIVRPIFNKSLGDIIKERRLLTQYDIDYNKTKLAEDIISKILKGKYQYDKDGEKIFFDTNRYVKLNFSSSGQQESLWILLLLFIIILEKQNVFIVIEEPEAHLFPEAQKEISNLIALMSNVENSQVIITTHSPYILASINNLILANKVGSENAKVADRINQNLWIRSDKVYAALVANGQAKEIIDSELNIIQQEKIDSVSSTINHEFDFLFQFETV